MRRWPRTTPSTRTRVVLVVARIPCAALSRRCGCRGACQTPSQTTQHSTACPGTTTNCCVHEIHDDDDTARRVREGGGRRSTRRDGWRRLCTHERTNECARQSSSVRRCGVATTTISIIITINMTTMGNEPQPQPVTVTVSAALSRVIGHIHGTALDASQRSDVLRRLDRHIDESSRKVRRDARFDFARRRARHRGW